MDLGKLGLHAGRVRRSISIRTQLVLNIVLFTLIPILVLSTVYFTRINTLVREKVLAYSSGIIRQRTAMAEALMKQVEVIWKQVVDIAALTDALYTSEGNVTNFTSSGLSVSVSYLKNLKRSFPFISNIYLVNRIDQVISTARNPDYSDLLRQPWLRETGSGDIPGIKLTVHDAGYSESSAIRPEKVLTVVSRITPYGLLRNSVTLVIDFNYALIFENLQSEAEGPSPRLTLYDNSGRVYYDPVLDRVGKSLLAALPAGTTVADLFREGQWEGGGHLSLGSSISPFGWVVCQIPFQELSQELSTTMDVYFIALFALIGLTIILSYFVVNGIVRPLVHLIDGMNLVKKGDLSTPLEETGNKEFLKLAQTFNAMQSEMTGLLERIALKERETLRAEILALQSQINPHFLYNTMDVLRGMAFEKRFREIACVTESLGKLFRYAQGGKSEFVTLEQELAHLSDYVEIQRHRFGDRFDFVSRVSPDCLKATVMRFILQPIVENAFQHGIEGKGAVGSIEVEATRTGSDLLICVVDNGAGIDAARLQKIRSNLGEVRESQNTGIGIANVHNRIRLHFGHGYGISIESELGIQTRVSMRLVFQVREGAK